MAKFEKIPSDDDGAPKFYVVRIELDRDEKLKGNRFIYYKTYTDLAKYLNCSREKVKNLIGDNRTISFNEYFNMNRKRL